MLLTGALDCKNSLLVLLHPYKLKKVKKQHSQNITWTMPLKTFLFFLSIALTHMYVLWMYFNNDFIENEKILLNKKSNKLSAQTFVC